MHEVSIVMFNRAGHFPGEDQPLRKSAQAITRRLAPQIDTKTRQGSPKPSLQAKSQRRGDYPQGVVMNVLRQVVNRSLDLSVYRMAGRVVRMAQGKNTQPDTTLLQRPNFLRNEGFRQSWVTL